MGPRSAIAAAQEGPETVDRFPSVEARGFLTGSEHLERASRLARSSDIRRCLTLGKRHRAEHLEVIWAENDTGHPRMGLIVPRFQSSAVARNRVRRRLREVWRREVQGRQPAWDLVVRARPSAYQATFAELRGELLAWRDAVLPSL